MDNAILAAIIGAVAAILGAVLQAYGKELLDILNISKLKIPSLTGEWEATWYVTENNEERIYTTDIIELTHRGGIYFKGLGYDERGNYKILGMFNSHRIITFSYDSGLTLYALVGGGVLLPNATFNELSGYWHGYVQEEKIVGGRVIWKSNKPTKRHNFRSLKS